MFHFHFKAKITSATAATDSNTATSTSSKFAYKNTHLIVQRSMTNQYTLLIVSSRSPYFRPHRLVNK